MKIKANDQRLDLPPALEMEIENTSPYFCEKGSMSASMTLGYTVQNSVTLQDPANPSRQSKLPVDIDIEQEFSGIVRRGKLNITQATTDGINCNIGYDEGLIYKRIAETKLAKMDNLPTYVPAGGESVRNLLDHLTRVMQYRENADYFVFPVLTAYDEETNTGGSEKEITYSMLNEVITDGSVHFSKQLIAYNDRKIKIQTADGPAEIAVMQGYGVSPFIKLHVLLHLIWHFLGYRLIESPFESHPQLSKLVLLNNTYDACVKGSVAYSQIMPDVTINDVFEMLWGRFGARCFINSNTRTARICLIRDSISNPAKTDLSGLEIGTPTSIFAPYRQIRLSSQTSFTNASTEEDSYEDFLKKIGNVCSDLNNAQAHSNDRPDIGKYTYIRNRLTGEYMRRDTFDFNKLQYLSSSFFKYDKKDSLEYEDISSPDEAVPVVYKNISFVPLPFYDCGCRHFNTSMRLNTESKDRETDSTDVPLALCFAIGRSVDKSYHFGSPFGWDSEGESRFTDGDGNKYDLDLTYQGEYGLFKHFWREYDAVLRHAGQELSQSFLIDNHKLSSFDFTSKIMSLQQPYLVKSFKQVLSDNLVYPAEFKLISTRLRKPYDLALEQAVPIPEQQKYYWQKFSQMDVVIAARHIALTNELKEKYPESIIYANGYDKEILSSPLSSEFMINPPTSLASSVQKRYAGVYTVKVTYKYLISELLVGQKFTEELEYTAGVVVAKI